MDKLAEIKYQSRPITNEQVDWLIAEVERLRKDLDGIGTERMEAAQRRDEITSLKGELAACEDCHEKLEKEVERLRCDEGYPGIAHDYQQCKVEVERLTKMVAIMDDMATQKNDLCAEVERLTKRCEEARHILSLKGSDCSIDEILSMVSKWLAGKP